MLKGHDIIYLAGHDFGIVDSKVSTDHIAQHLSRENRILYVESVGLRAPKATAKDMSRIGRKLSKFFRPPKQISERFWVLTPLAGPVHHVPGARWMNQQLLTAHIRWASRRLHFRRPVVFVFLPTMGGVVSRLGEAVSVYYCTDEHAAFPGVDGPSVRRAEEDLLRKVTLGFATSLEILKNKQRFNANIHYSPHAVDYDNFARAQDPGLTTPEELSKLSHPMIGYFGAIERWIDLDLIGALARARPTWSFVFIGRPAVEVSSVASLPNVHFLGQRPFKELPRYGRAFDAAIIPFKIDELTVSVSPIKLKEYLAMGKPVVSTPMPAVVEMAQETGLVDVATDAETFLARLEHLLRTDSPELARRRQDSVRGDTWEARATEVGRVVDTWLRRHALQGEYS